MLSTTIKYHGNEYTLVPAQTVTGAVDDLPAFKQGPLRPPSTRELGFGQRPARPPGRVVHTPGVRLSPEQKTQQSIKSKIVAAEQELSQLRAEQSALDTTYSQLVDQLDRAIAGPVTPETDKLIRETKQRLPGVDEKLRALSDTITNKQYALFFLKQRAPEPAPLQQIDRTPLSIERSPAELADPTLKRPATMLEKDIAFLQSHLEKLTQVKDKVTGKDDRARIEKDIRETQEVIKDKQLALSHGSKHK